MEWIPLNSTNLTAARYDESSNTLEVEFKGGKIYQYFDIPLQVFEGLIHSESHGQYLNEQIKGHYRYARL